MTTIPISSIIIDRRLRTEYGDLEDLNSIEHVGLIEPVILQEKITNDSQVSYHLVAGGRRLQKLILLGATELFHGATMTPGKPGFLFRDEVPEDVARECELYENVARKQMTWKERVLSIEEIHHLKIKRSGDGDWTEEATGRELGMARANTSHILRIARALRDPKSPVHEATGTLDALKIIAGLKVEEAQRRSMELAKQSSRIIISPDSQAMLAASSTRLNATEARVDARVIPLSSMLFNAKMEDVLAELPPESVDGIYTDWPYGIDMDNIQQQNLGMNVASTAAEHDADDNMRNFTPWLKHMARVLKPSSFCVIWGDLEHWSYMSAMAISCGFRVQRWPFHWVKTHPCQNGAAQYNQTKAVEHAMVLRMPGAVLTKQIPNNYWIGTFDPGEKKASDHPFAKPRKLHERVLGDFFTPGSTILDPFAGTMGISLACIHNGYHPMAVEMVKNHYDKGEFNIMELYRALTLNNVKFT